MIHHHDLLAEQERQGIRMASARLAEEGIPCAGVSVGSTPTARFAESFAGVTEVRAGTYMFNDLFQAGLGTCTIQDVALSVLATVVSHSRRGDFYLVDAGMLALSQDTSAGEHWDQVGYGFVLDEGGIRLAGQYVSDVHQEHGFVRCDGPLDLDRVPIGSHVRIVPNHACSTAAMFDGYHVIDEDLQVVEIWDRTNRW